jgi:hypothetical protein
MNVRSRFRFAARQSYNTPRRKLFQARRQVVQPDKLI